MNNEDQVTEIPEHLPEPPPLPVDDTPGVSDTIIIYVLACGILLVIGGLLQELNLLVGLLITELILVIGPPILYTLWYRYPFRPTFHIAPISMKTVVLTIIIAGAAFVLVGAISFGQQAIVPPPQEYGERWGTVFRQLFRLPFPVILGVMAGLPGLCEEVLFRGFLLRGFRGKYSDGVSIVVVGCLFGIFHFDPYKLLSTTLLGILFGYLVVRTGSIFTGMVAHVTNNAIAISLAYMAFKLQGQDIDAFSSTPDFESIPLKIFIIGGIFLFFFVGIALTIFILGLRALPRAPERVAAVKS